MYDYCRSEKLDMYLHIVHTNSTMYNKKIFSYFWYFETLSNQYLVLNVVYVFLSSMCLMVMAIAQLRLIVSVWICIKIGYVQQLYVLSMKNWLSVYWMRERESEILAVKGLKPVTCTPWPPPPYLGQLSARWQVAGCEEARGPGCPGQARRDQEQHNNKIPRRVVSALLWLGPGHSQGYLSLNTTWQTTARPSVALPRITWIRGESELPQTYLHIERTHQHLNFKKNM